MSEENFLYRISSSSEWFDFKKKKIMKCNSVDLESDFIHLSSKEQINGTLKKYFKHKKNLYLIKLFKYGMDEKIKWEKSRDNMLFPHYYGDILIENVNKVFKINFKNEKVTLNESDFF